MQKRLTGSPAGVAGYFRECSWVPKDGSEPVAEDESGLSNPPYLLVHAPILFYRCVCVELLIPNRRNLSGTDPRRSSSPSVNAEGAARRSPRR